MGQHTRLRRTDKKLASNQLTKHQHEVIHRTGKHHMKTLKYLSTAARSLLIATPLILMVACGGGGGGSTSTALPYTSAITVPASKQTSYVKVCINGDIAGTGICPQQPALTATGAAVNPADWGCTLDKSTGLLWEAGNFEFRKLNGSPNNTLFTNYTSATSLQKWIGDPNDPTLPHKALAPTQAEVDSMQNAAGYKTWVNNKSLCGNAKWRIPKSDELQNLYIEHLYSKNLIPGTGIGNVPGVYFVDKFFPGAASEPYISSSYLVRPGVGRGDESEDLFSDAVSFYGYGSSDLYLLLQTTSATRQHPWSLRLVADCNCKSVGSTQAVRNWGRSVLLSNGSVLTMGEPNATTFAELFNPATELWTSAGQFAASDLPLLPSQRHSATLVGDKVIVIGGVTASGLNNKVWIYDARLQTWTMGADALTRHIAHGAVAVGTSKVLVIGGDCQFGGGVTCTSGSVEEYDVTADTWTQKSPMPIPLHSSSTTQLADGRILVAGGSNNFGSVNTAQIYDPTTNIWSIGTSSMNESRYYHTATLLLNGKVLVTGGNQVLNGVATASKTAEIYDPSTNAWSMVASMSTNRILPTATLLSGGRVLVAGGADAGAVNVTDSVEIYEPRSNTWTLACSLRGSRYAHNATLLADGKRILISGGRVSAATATTSAELYTP